MIIFLLAVLALDFFASLLVDDARALAKSFGVPEFIVGVSLVAMGTSLPELATAAYATITGRPEIAVADAIGSSVGNILLSLGLIALIAGRIVVEYPLIHVDLPYMVAAAFFSFIAFFDGALSKTEALLMLFIYASYFLYLVSKSKAEKKVANSGDGKGEKNPAILAVKILIEGVIIWFTAKIAVESILAFSSAIGISAEALAAVLIAVSTGLPELAVSVKGVRKGLPALAVGNLLGSNIFNTFGILGLCGIAGRVTAGQLTPVLLNFFLIASLLFFFISQENDITKWEGLLLLGFYGLYLLTIF